MNHLAICADGHMAQLVALGTDVLTVVIAGVVCDIGELSITIKRQQMVESILNTNDSY